MTISATVGTSVPLVMILDDGSETQYPQAEVYLPGGTTPLTTVDLEHKAKGRYEGSWTPLAANIYSVHFIVYADVGHSAVNIYYSREIEQVIAFNENMDTVADKLLRALGLVHENVFIDDTAHDINGQLVAARIRIFNSKAAAEAATDGGSETTGLVATYSMTTVYETRGKMGTYRMVRD